MSRDNAQPDSSPETSAFRGIRAVRISPEAHRLLMSSCISDAGIVNQRPFGARGLSMCGETIREHSRDGRPGTRPRLSAGPPRETSAHATPCRKTAYARRKTRTPRPGGQGVHSEPVGDPISRSPREVGRAKRVSNWRVGFRFPERARYPIGALEKGSGSLGGSEMTPSEHPLAQEPGSAGQSFVATSSIAKSAGSSSVTVFQSRSKSTPQ